MPRFALNRDIRFFESISKELVDAVIETTVVLFKLAIDDISTNLYGESLNKSYYQGTECTAVIERDDSSVSYEGFGSDSGQNVEFRFNRITVKRIKDSTQKLVISLCTMMHILKLIM